MQKLDYTGAGKTEKLSRIVSNNRKPLLSQGCRDRGEALPGESRVTLKRLDP